MSEELQLPSKNGGSFMAYVAMPKITPAPTVIVIQEIFGVNQGLRDKCDWLASEGFIAVCPDLFWRMEPGVQLTDQSEEDWQKAFDFYNRFDIDLGVEDLRATFHTFKDHANGNGKVGCIGYCLGGKLAYLVAARTNIDTSIGYYGVGLDELLGEANDIKNPLMLHMPEEDEFVPAIAQEKVKDGLADNGLVTIHSYPKLNHAFTRVGGKHYNDEGAKLSDDRTLAFLRHNLDIAQTS